MKTSKEQERDTRPVKCYICGKKMYYHGHKLWEREYNLVDDYWTGYVHASCIKFLKNKSRKIRR